MDSSAMTGIDTEARTSAIAFKSCAGIGCSSISGSWSMMRSTKRIASLALRIAMFASTRTRWVAPTASRTWRTASTSVSMPWPVLTLTVRKPSRARSSAYCAICSGSPCGTE